MEEILLRTCQDAFLPERLIWIYLWIKGQDVIGFSETMLMFSCKKAGCVILIGWHGGLQEVFFEFYMGIKRIWDSVVSKFINVIFIILNGAVKIFFPFPTTYFTNMDATFKEVSACLTLSSVVTRFIPKGKHLCSDPTPHGLTHSNPAEACNPQGAPFRRIRAFPEGGHGSTSQCIQSCQVLMFNKERLKSRRDSNHLYR